MQHYNKVRWSTLFATHAFILFFAFWGTMEANASDSFVVYRVGQALDFFPGDIKEISFHSDRLSNTAVMKIEITEAMSSRLSAFTAELSGKIMMTVLMGEIGSDDTLIRERISGNTLHIGGPNTPEFYQLVQRLEAARQRFDQPQSALIETFERIEKIIIPYAEIVSCSIFQRNIRLKLSMIITKKLPISNINQDNVKLIVFLGGKLIYDESNTSVIEGNSLKLQGIDRLIFDSNFMQVCGNASISR